MQLGEDENYKDDLPGEKPRVGRIKQMLLEENFEKAEITRGLKKKDKENRIPSKKRPFFYLGVFLILAAIVCLIITEQAPWFYIKCEMKGNENNTIESFYYKDFVNKNGNYCNQVTSLFESVNGSYLTGLSVDDFILSSIISYYSFLMLIFLGLFFTVFVILYKVFKYSYETMIMIQQVFSAAAAVICIFLLTVFIRFVAAHILFYHNVNTIYQILPDASISFPVPIIMIIFLSFILKICFTMLKMSYRELERKTEHIRKKTGFTYKV